MNTFFGFRTLAITGFIAIVGFSACNNKPATTTASSSTIPGTVSGRFAYVNLDSLEEHYTFWKTKKQEMMAQQASIESELQRSAQQLQSDYAAMQQKAKAGTLSQAEGEAAQQRLAQMQQSLESRRATLSEKLQKDQMEFSQTLQKSLDDYLATYNKDNKFDFIFSYTKAGAILYANKALDITNDVIKGLNATTPSATTTDAAKTK